MGLYDVGTDVYFLDPHLARTALYRPGGDGAGMTVRVVESRPDVSADFSVASVVVGTAVFGLRVAEVDLPAEGDTIEMGGELFTICAAPLRDETHTMWTVVTRVS